MSIKIFVIFIVSFVLVACNASSPTTTGGPTLARPDLIQPAAAVTTEVVPSVVEKVSMPSGTIILDYGKSQAVVSYDSHGGQTHTVSNGNVEVYDKWGNTLRKSKSSGEVSYSPYAIVFPTEPLKEGLRWGGSYHISYPGGQSTWKADCSVVEFSSVTVAAGTFPAWKVKCERLRVGKQYPRYEESWVSAQGRISLKERVWWYGHTPGSQGSESTELQSVDSGGSTFLLGGASLAKN